jgi:hypothetical protein
MKFSCLSNIVCESKRLGLDTRKSSGGVDKMTSVTGGNINGEIDYRLKYRLIPSRVSCNQKESRMISAKLIDARQVISEGKKGVARSMDGQQFQKRDRFDLKGCNRTMKAVVTTGNGGYEKLEYRDVPIPEPASGEVLLQVLAAGVNNTEINTRLGWYSSRVTASTEALTTGEEEMQEALSIHPGHRLLRSGGCCCTGR